MSQSARHGTVRRAATVLSAALLALIGLVVPASAGAANGWTTTVDVTGASEDDGLELHVTGRGYTGLPDATASSPSVGIYVGLRDPADSLNDIAADTGLVLGTEFLFGAANIHGGNWSTDLEIDAAELDPAVDYQVFIWAAHGNPTDETVIDEVPIDLTDAQKQALFPGWTPPTSTTTTTTTTTTTPGHGEPGRRTVATVTGASAADGLTVDVQGTGYTNLPDATASSPAVGIYVGLRDPADSYSAIAADTDLVLGTEFLFGAANIHGGNWSTDLEIDAAELDPDVDYQVFIWAAHGNPTDETVLDIVDLDLTDAQREALFGGGRPPATTAPPTTAPPTTRAPKAPGTTRPAPKRHTTIDDAGLRCVTETVAGTAGTPKLDWGVRSSFVNYIEGGVAKGSVETSGGVVRSGNGFTWPDGTGEVDDAGRGTWSFSGAVHFSGHKGVLNTTLSNLKIRVDGSSGTLVADVQSQDMDGNDVSGSAMTVAELHFSSISPAGGTATATLTRDGARALNSMYEPGESMDPVTVSVSGGTAGSSVENCYDADGNLVSSTPVAGSAGSGQLPATGFGAWRLAAAGALMILLGMLALAVTTRRRRLHAAAG